MAQLISTPAAPAAAPMLSTTPRVLIALPGLHAVNRGAEVAFESIATRLAADHGFDVTVMGSGEQRPEQAYRYVKVPRIRRERFRSWPKTAALRDETAYEEASFAAAMLAKYRPRNYDVTVTCGYPYLNWLLRARRRHGRPRHVYVTQNGDWPCYRSNSEYRFFGCDLLVCTNPDYFDSHASNYRRSVLIPNGVDPNVFHPQTPRPSIAEIPAGQPLVLMVSALIPSKRVLEGIRAVAQVPNVTLLVAGDGPQRDEVEHIGNSMMPNRFFRRSFHREQMSAVFRGASVFLHMSIDEPSANAYIEALATGLPIVAHDRAVTRWTFGENALLVDTLDSAAVSAAVQSAVAELPGPQVGRRIEMAKARFDWRAIGARYASEIRNLLHTT